MWISSDTSACKNECIFSAHSLWTFFIYSRSEKKPCNKCRWIASTQNALFERKNDIVCKWSNALKNALNFIIVIVIVISIVIVKRTGEATNFKLNTVLQVVQDNSNVCWVGFSRASSLDKQVYAFIFDALQARSEHAAMPEGTGRKQIFCNYGWNWNHILSSQRNSKWHIFLLFVWVFNKRQQRNVQSHLPLFTPLTFIQNTQFSADIA